MYTEQLSSSTGQKFDQMLYDGIRAAKNRQRTLAQSLLNQAILLDPNDSRPWIWLAETTHDPGEKREYLEKAVAIDPGNSMARRALAILNGKIDPQALRPDRTWQINRGPRGPEDARAKTFLCPQCGGRLSYFALNGKLTCEYCGFAQGSPEHQDGMDADQVLDFVMPTDRGQSWAAAQHRLACEQCGSVRLLPPGEKTARCPYCGSNQWIESSESAGLIDPQEIILMKVDRNAAAQAVRKWLGRGLFAPDDLISARKVDLRLMYASCWSFDGSIEVHWSCEVRQGSGAYEHWDPRSGEETAFFDDVLAPGVKAIELDDFQEILPFGLKKAQPFTPETVAGWPALFYDRSLADASLLAREQVVKKQRSLLVSRIETGSEKRNLTISGSKWSGMTFKHIFLPLWVGSYHYRGKSYSLLVNGETGKVGGHKPVDRVKAVLAAAIAGLAVFLLAVVLWQLLFPH